MTFTKNLVLIAALIPVLAGSARADSVGAGMVKVDDKLLLSDLLGVPDPVSKDNPRHHGIKLKTPVSVSITAELGDWASATAHSGDMLYFANGKIQNTVPGWTSWCSAWRAPEGETPADFASGILPSKTDGMVPVLGRRLSEACWTVVLGLAKGPDALIDLHLGGGTSWVIDCHHIAPDIKVGGLRKIFGQHRIMLAVPETAAGLAASAAPAAQQYETAVRKPAALSEHSGDAQVPVEEAPPADDTPCTDCDSKTVTFANGTAKGKEAERLPVANKAERPMQFHHESFK